MLLSYKIWQFSIYFIKILLNLQLINVYNNISSAQVTDTLA
jgi:hypothetical protein